VENSRYSVTQVGDDDGPPEADNSWMLSYLDVLTLLIAFFVLLLAMSEPKTEEEEILRSMASAAGGADSEDPTSSLTPSAGPDGVLGGGIGVLPQYNAVIAGDEGDSSPDAVAGGSVDEDNNDNEERFGELEDSLNSLALQGVDAEIGREGLTLRIADNLLFASGESELRYDGMILISQLREVLESFDGEISVEGHTDSIPINTLQFPSNWELSSARAISVLRYLEADGIEAARMRAIGYADTRPLQSNNSAEGRASNRRVEIVLREPG
jgi:chemotaxis protein MotB